MLLAEAIELLEAGENIVREAWSLEDGYLAFLQGMAHIWKIVLAPSPNAGNYIFSKDDLKASDWKKFAIPAPAIEGVLEEHVEG